MTLYNFSTLGDLGSTVLSGYKAGQKALEDQQWGALADRLLAGGSTPGAAPQTLASLGSNTGAPSDSYVAKTAMAEASGDPTAKNPNSSATGLGGFTDGTWAGMIRTHPELNLTPDGRTDAAQSQRAIAAFTNDNANVLKSAGLPVNGQTLRMTHFLGAGGGPTFLSGLAQNPDAPATSLVSADAARANPTIFYNQDGSQKSARQVFAQVTAGFGGGGAGAADLPAAGARTASTQGGDDDSSDTLPSRPGSGGAGPTDAQKAMIGMMLRNENTRAAGLQMWSQLSAKKNFSAPFTYQGKLYQMGSDGEMKSLGDAQEQVKTLLGKEERLAAGVPESYNGIVQIDKSGKVMLVGGGDDTADKRNKGEATLRGEFEKKLGTFNDVHDAYGRVISAVEQRSKDPNSVSPASDIALIFGYMKMLDPGSVVREGEYATAANAAGIPERIINAYNKTLSGEFLSGEQRQDFASSAQRLYAQSRTRAEQYGDRFSRLAAGQGLNPENVVNLPPALSVPVVGGERTREGEVIPGVPRTVPPAGQGAPGQGRPAQAKPITDDVRSAAREAVRQGAPAAAVLQRLREQGYDASAF